MGNLRFRAGVLVCAALTAGLVSSRAMAQSGGSGSSNDTGCDGEEKGVVVPCAGIEFCTCAQECSYNSECLSDCCQDGVCLPKCVCEGRGYSTCKVGEYPSDARESESGGCSVQPVTSASGHAGSGLAILVLCGLLACSRSGREKGGQRARS